MREMTITAFQLRHFDASTNVVGRLVASAEDLTSALASGLALPMSIDKLFTHLVGLVKYKRLASIIEDRSRGMCTPIMSHLLVA
jgi:hypothetical protein